MKKTVVVLLYFCLILNVFSASIPADKNEFLFKNDDSYDQGLGNASIALSNKMGIITNPASLTELKQKHFMITYKVSDYNDILSKDEVVTGGEPSGLYYTSNVGGFYIRNLSDGKQKNVIGEKFHSYNLDLKEIGVAISQKSDTIEGLSTGLNLKLFLGHIMDAKILDDGKVDYLNTDRGFGGGFDFGLIYKKEYVSFGLTWNDIFSRTWWSKYSATTINGSINSGFGLDFNFIRYGFSVKKVLLDDYPFQYGSGLEMIVVSLPKEYSFALLKEGRIKLRTGVYGENIIEDKKEYHYGTELSNTKGFMDIVVVSKKVNLFNVLDDNVYKMTLGIDF